MFTNLAKKHALPSDVGRNAFILLSGLNHKHADVNLREQLTINEEKLLPTLQSVLRYPGIDEAVVVNTCNRVEVIAAGSKPENYADEAIKHVESVLEEVSGVDRNSFSGALYHFSNTQAVEHVFRVASGLDSMVLGEPQILGQLKRAYDQASLHGTTSTLLNKLFHRAFNVAKTIRTSTDIGRNAVSVCYAAKELAQQIFGDLEDSSVMLIGAGEIGLLSLKHFHAAKAKRLFLANRTVEQAVEQSKRFGAVPLSLSQIEDFLPQADIIIGACTLSMEQDYILNKKHIQNSLKKRNGKSQFLIDLSVPRNFCKNIDQVPQAFLYNIDDLETVVEQNKNERLEASVQAELLIGEEVKKFSDWLSIYSLEPVIKELMDRCEEYKSAEIRKTLKRLGVKDANMHNALDDFADALLAKVLHHPLTTLKEQGSDNEAVVEAFAQLFLGLFRSKKNKS